MSKVYLLTEADIERLKLLLVQDPKRVVSLSLDDAHSRNAWDTAQRFFNFQVHTWISEVTK